MSRNAPRSFATAIGLAAVCVLAPASMAGGALPSLDAPELAQGPYSSMHMLLQKTVLKINVATVDVRVDKPTQARFAELARGQQYSYPLDAQLAAAAIAAPHAVVQMQFVRDVPLNRWIGVVRDNLELAREAGLITATSSSGSATRSRSGSRRSQERGYQKRRRLIYAVTPGRAAHGGGLGRRAGAARSQRARGGGAARGACRATSPPRATPASR